MKYSKTYIVLGFLVLCVGASSARADSITPACPSTPITHALTVGSRDAGTAGDVSRLQTFLGISPTGYFGPITKAGVITFQNNNSIVPAVGYVGPLTRAAITARCNAGSGNTADISFSASPPTGSAPLAVAFTSTGTGLGASQYIIDYGDGANSGSVQSYCTTPQGGATTSDCSLTAGHTYQAAGVYTASLSPYVACMWSTPRCMLASQLLGSATITVGHVATTSSLVVPGSATLAPGQSASANGAFYTYTLTLNAVHLPSSGAQAVSADFIWTESHCGTSGCLGAADPAPQSFTLHLSGGVSTYTSALGHTMTLSAVAANSATVSVSK